MPKKIKNLYCLYLIFIIIFIIPMFVNVKISSERYNKSDFADNQGNDIARNVQGSGVVNLPNFVESNLYTFSYAVSSIDFYDFAQDLGCIDVLVGINYGKFYLFKGQTIPFGGAWTEFKQLSPTGTQKVVGAFGVPINGIEENTTDIYTIVETGTHFFFRNTATQSRDYYVGPNANWLYAHKGDVGADLASPLTLNPITVAEQAELGGLYNLNDEFVIGSDGSGSNDGAIVMVVTESTTYSGGDFEEYLITDNFISEKVYDLKVGDINNDGDNDVIAAIGNYIYVFENDGTPRNGEWTYQKIYANPQNINAITLADLNLDGYLDIIAGLSNGGVAIYNNTHNPHSEYFNPMRIKYSSIGVAINDLEAGDLDNDGDVDLIVGLNNGSIIELENKLHMPVGFNEEDPFISGTWDHKLVSSKSGTKINVLKLNDFDLDGDLDLIAGYENGETCLYQNLRSPPSVAKLVFSDKEEIIDNTISSNYFSNLAVGDIDNDGAIDIAVDSYTTASVRSNIYILKNPGYSVLKDLDLPNTWTSLEAYYEINHDYYDIELNDIDNDGDLDIVFNEDQQYIKGLQNDGTPFTGAWAATGSATTLVDISTASVSQSQYFWLGDMDSDWKQEFIWTGSASGTNQGNVRAFRESTNPWSSWSTINLINFGEGTPIKYALVGSFDNDNFLDLVLFDGNNKVYLVKGAVNIDSIGLTDYWNIWTGSNHDVNVIALTDVGFDNREDIIIVGNLNTQNIYALINSYEDIRNDPDWTLRLRSSFSSDIYGCTTADLTNDGSDEILFWTSTSLYVIEGNKNEFQSETNKLIDNVGETIKDVETADVDQDGDLDIIIATSDSVYIYYNRIRDDIYPASLTVEYSIEGYTITINATSNETLHTDPQIYISLGSIHEYGVMVNANDPMEPLKWTYQYYIQRNGNYTVVINSTDLYGNFGETYSSFEGYHPLADVNITISSESPTPNYSNGSINITITNSSLPVYTDYSPSPSGDLLLNITDPSSNTEWIVATYQGGNTWSATYNNIDEDGTWSIGLNYTDSDRIVYNYIVETFMADVTPPSIQNAYEPSFNGSIYYRVVYLNLNLTFTEPIIDLWYWASKYNESLGYEQKLSNVESVLLLAEGNTTVDILYNLPASAVGNINLTVMIRDKAGNYNTYKFNITIYLFYPVAYDFFIRDPTTGEKNIEGTHSRTIIIGWEAVNCTHIRYSVGIGNEANWSDPIEYNDFYRQNYPIQLGEKPGLYNITVRFYNYYNYVEMSRQIYYYGEEVPPFPWGWFVFAAAMIGVGYVVYKVITKPRERSWKEYLDEVEY
ncbi:MAG: FG-GAP repeat domain-containing protein [Promethearchaeota archaeon]